MTEEQAQADRLAEKLQAFYDGLPEGEQDILVAVLQQAAGTGDVEGYIPTEPIRSAQFKYHPGDPAHPPDPVHPPDPILFTLRASAAGANPSLATKLTIPVGRTTFR